MGEYTGCMYIYSTVCHTIDNITPYIYIYRFYGFTLYIHNNIITESAVIIELLLKSTCLIIWWQYTMCHVSVPSRNGQIDMRGGLSPGVSQKGDYCLYVCMYVCCIQTYIL